MGSTLLHDVNHDVDLLRRAVLISRDNELTVCTSTCDFPWYTLVWRWGCFNSLLRKPTRRRPLLSWRRKREHRLTCSVGQSESRSKRTIADIRQNIERLLRFLAANDFLTNPARDAYGANMTTMVFADDLSHAAMIHQ
jgi:hypothetical protein